MILLWFYFDYKNKYLVTRDWSQSKTKNCNGQFVLERSFHSLLNGRQCNQTPRSVAYDLGLHFAQVRLSHILSMNMLNSLFFFFLPNGVSRAPDSEIKTNILVTRLTRPLGFDGSVGCAEVCNILSWRLIMKYILRSFSPFR